LAEGELILTFLLFKNTTFASYSSYSISGKISSLLTEAKSLLKEAWPTNLLDVDYLAFFLALFWILMFSGLLGPNRLGVPSEFSSKYFIYDKVEVLSSNCF